MSVANLTKYSLSELGSGITTGQYSAMMVVDSNGDFVKFEEAVEASSNSLQQLKAEIAALLTEYYHYHYEVNRPKLANSTWNKLRQLSAV